MFQFLRRVSGSFLPRPDRPWRDDATSHAPTIGRKRRHSVTEQDGDRSPSSVAKRTKNDPVKPDTECDPESGRENPTLPAERRDVKSVTKGVKEVDLEDKDEPEDTPSIQPEGVPLPDSPSGSPEPEPEPAKPVEVEEEHADDEDSVVSSADNTEKEAETDSASACTNASADEIPPAQEVVIAVRSDLHDTLETMEVKA